MNYTLKTLCVSFLCLSGCAVLNGTENVSEDKNAVQAQVLDQQQDYADMIAGKYWKLVKLEGQDVVMSEQQEREAHFILKTKENKLTGYSGCNNFFGSYLLEKGNRIRFSQLGATKRACPDLQVNEDAFLQVFALSDNYRISGDVLELNVGRRAPLAIFEAVYFQ